ncbi:MAG: hypothetical protein WC788_04370 [Candidatus Paceibacterota bacterium]|jgi:hypothetical protein
MSGMNNKADSLTVGEWMVNLQMYSWEMEKGGTYAVAAFNDLLDMLKGFDLVKAHEKMCDDGNLFGVVCFLRDFSRNLAGSFGEGSTGFPIENGTEIYYEILKEMGIYVKMSLFREGGSELKATIEDIYVNYARLLKVTQEAMVQGLPEDKFATM